MYRPFVFSLLIIIGLSSIILKKQLGLLHWAYPYLDEAGSILLTSGVLSLLYKIFMDKQQRRELHKLFRVHESIAMSGLTQTQAAANEYRFGKLIEESKKLVVVMNDGYRWVGNLQVALEKRFNKNGFTTELFTIDQNGDYFKALKNKVDSTDDELRQKIAQSRERLASIYEASAKHGTLKMYSMSSFPTHSIFLFDDKAIVTFYQIGKKRMDVPLLEVEKTTRREAIYNFLLEDINNVRKEAECVYDSEDQ